MHYECSFCSMWKTGPHFKFAGIYSNQDHSYFSGWFVTPRVSKICFLFQSHIILTGFNSKFTFIRLFWHWLKLQFCIEFQFRNERDQTIPTGTTAPSTKTKNRPFLHNQLHNSTSLYFLQFSTKIIRYRDHHWNLNIRCHILFYRKMYMPSN